VGQDLKIDVVTAAVKNTFYILSVIWTHILTWVKLNVPLKLISCYLMNMELWMAQWLMKL